MTSSTDHDASEPADRTDDDAPYRHWDDVDPAALRVALSGLALVGDDPYLNMQTTNMAVVDIFVMQLEAQAYDSQFDEERSNLPDLVFLGAQSQMWLFAVYELLRTWRARARLVRGLLVNGKLADLIDHLENDAGALNFGRRYRIAQYRRALATKGYADRITEDLARTFIPYTRLEALRVILAKHEMPDKRGSIASTPGYGRINAFCGALDYDIQIGNTSLGSINRRDVADELRAIREGHVPTAQEIEDFKAFMKSADAEVQDAFKTKPTS